MPAADSSRTSQRGHASYYSDRLAGRATASGEPYAPRELTAAHRSLPFGAVVDVIRDDGRRVQVRINDRGPFTKNRIIDVSRRAAEMLGMIREGTAEVLLQVVSLPPPSKKKKRRR
jgi:rare lipoprotein A